MLLPKIKKIKYYNEFSSKYFFFYYLLKLFTPNKANRQTERTHLNFSHINVYIFYINKPADSPHNNNHSQ